MTRDPSTPEPSDEHLAAVIARRDAAKQGQHDAQEACRQLYARHSRLLLAFLIARLGRRDPEDVHQLVWQRVWERVPQELQPGGFRGWLYQVARHCVIDRVRKKVVQPLGERDLPDSRTDAQADSLAEQERSEVLRCCLERLGNEMAALVRSRLGGESYDTICARLQLPPARAHKLFFQAKEQLQQCVQKALS